MRRLATGICLICAIAIAADGQTFAQTDSDEANSRGVRIIAAPTPAPPNRLDQPPAPAPPTPTALPPPLPQTMPDKLVPPVSGLTPNKTSVMPAPTDLLPGSASAAPASSPPPTPRLPNASVEKPNEPPNLTPSTIKSAPQQAPVTTAPAENIARLPAPSAPQTNQKDLEALAAGIKVSNNAGLSVNILPGLDVTVGSRVFFQVSTKKSGYLILIDVDARGKLTQIYPNPLSVIGPGGVREKSNFIQAGKSFYIPDRGSAYSGFEFVAAPPVGTAMIIALLSEHPVQLVDLPNVPSQLVGSVSSIDYLSKIADELRIPGRSASDRLQEAHWSFDVRFYAIR
jgi:Domain of unknown function (DUF4384)